MRRRSYFSFAFFMQFIIKQLNKMMRYPIQLHRTFNPILWFLLIGVMACTQGPKDRVLVVGGGTSGVAAALSSARSGVPTVLLVEGPWLGGMLTSAGVSAIDGNAELPSGFWGEFRDSLIGRYGSAKALRTGWVSNHLFDPSVGAAIFKNMVDQEPLLNIIYHQTFSDIHQDEAGLWQVETVDTLGQINHFAGAIVIDATELGDVAAKAKIPYRLGMDSKDTFGETIAPDTPNSIIQDLTYVMILKNYGRKVPLKKPAGYDPAIFYCAALNDQCDPNQLNGRILWSKEKMMSYGQLPSGEVMINWPIFGNDYYVNAVELDPLARQAAFEQAKLRSLQFLYFIQTELGYDHYHLSDTTFPTADSLPLIPYHRESRRIAGEVTFTLNHLAQPYGQKDPLYRTGIAVGDYPVDHHHDRHPQVATLPKLYFYPIPAYALPLGSLLPKAVENFIVAEKSISVSNLVNGTTRLQPVVLQIGHVAGLLAAQSILAGTTPKAYPIRKLQQQLLDQGQYIQPYLDVPPDHQHFQAYQRIGSTGILRGVGKNEGWKNQMWFYPNKIIDRDELLLGLKDYVNLVKFPLPESLSYKSTLNWLLLIALHHNKQDEGLLNPSYLEKTLEQYNLEEKDPNSLITRGDFSVLIDFILDPFGKTSIDINGKMIIE